jgi:hypothetical protein
MSTPQIDHLPPQNLLDLARNESAMTAVRIRAAELLIDGGYKQANHPDIVDLVWTIKNNRAQGKDEKLEPSPEKFVPAPSPEGGLRASVTTESLLQDSFKLEE